MAYHGVTAGDVVMKPAVLVAMARGADVVAQALLERADVEILTMFEVVNPFFEAKGIPHRDFFEYLPQARRPAIKALADQRVAAVELWLQNGARTREWPYFTPESWSRLSAIHGGLVRNNLAQEIALIDTLRYCARVCDLRLVIVPQDICRDTKALTFAAHRLGIPVLHIMHGFPYGARNMHDAIYADLILAYSERSKALYEGMGIPGDRIVVTGNPEWDEQTRPHRPGARERVCQALGLDPGRPVVTYALSYIHRLSSISARHADYCDRTTGVIIRAFAELAQRHRDWQFVLRCHPNDPDAPQNLREQARACGLEEVCVGNNVSGYYALAATDTLVCVQSNLGIEAIFAGVPVVNVVIDEIAQAVFDEGMGRLFLDDDAVLHVRTAAEAAPLIEMAMLDEAARARLLAGRERSIRRFNGSRDGRAGERFAAIALDMIRRPERYVALVDRFAEYEHVIARQLPADVMRLAVVGRAARFVEGVIHFARPEARVSVFEGAPWGGLYEAVVFSDPLAGGAETDVALTGARERLGKGGALVAVFLNGAGPDGAEAAVSYRWAPACPGAAAAQTVGAFCRRGMELALRRNGFVIEEIAELPDIVYASGKTSTAPGIDASEADGWVVRARAG